MLFVPPAEYKPIYWTLWEQDCICGWRNSSPSSMSEHGMRQGLKQPWPDSGDNYSGKLENVNSFRVRSHLGVVAFLKRFLWTLPLHASEKVFWPCQKVGERQIHGQFKKRVGKRVLQTTGQWTGHWAWEIFSTDHSQKIFVTPQKRKHRWQRSGHC